MNEEPNVPVQERCAPSRCAIVSVVLGSISLVSWVVMIFGLFTSVLGIIFGIMGLKSTTRAKYARLGLILSIIGFLAALLYAYTASRGMINYSYFTTELLK